MICTRVDRRDLDTICMAVDVRVEVVIDRTPGQLLSALGHPGYSEVFAAVVVHALAEWLRELYEVGPSNPSAVSYLARVVIERELVAS